jgi:predicted MFS family arabinose efflux permease
VLAALRTPAYRNFWLGSLVANLGFWIQAIALGWLVYDLTRLPSWLGTVSFVGNLPTLVLGLVGGAIADRMSRGTVMLVSVLGLATSATLLALLTAFGHIDVWWILGLAMLSGIGMALYTPAMHSVIPQLVHIDDLADAVSLNSVQFNLARAVGPAVAGVLYGTIGPAGCFAVNATGFVVLAFVVSRLSLPPRPTTPPPPVLRALREGLRYVRGHGVIGPAIMLAAALSLFGFPYIILLPALARDVLHLDATGLGWLMTSVGTGAVLAGLGLGFARDAARRQALVSGGAILYGLAITTFAVVRSFPATMALLFVLGALQTVTIASLTTTIQLQVHDGMRGRVMSMITVIFFGFSTLGGLVGGLVSNRIGVPVAIAAGGVITTIAAVCLAWAAYRET